MEQDFIHVVIGVIKNTEDEVLVTKRHREVRLGGPLEFPGGKLKTGETPQVALKRELLEELNIHVHKCLPLIQIPFSYPDRNVFLDVYTIIDYSGLLAANESQKLAWRKISTLSSAEFPNANHGIICALQLPRLISVTPDLSSSPENFLPYFGKVVKNNDISVIQLRSHELNKSQYMKLAEKCLQLCKLHGCELILNREAEYLQEVEAAGLHLTSNRLLAVRERPLGGNYLVSASCHNIDEIRHASRLAIDYIFLGPVAGKNSSPGNYALGWNRFAELARESLIPVYAIGGLKINDVSIAVEHGGQGVATIRGLWSGVESG